MRIFFNQMTAEDYGDVSLSLDYLKKLKRLHDIGVDVNGVYWHFSEYQAYGYEEAAERLLACFTKDVEHEEVANHIGLYGVYVIQYQNEVLEKMSEKEKEEMLEKIKVMKGYEPHLSKEEKGTELLEISGDKLKFELHDQGLSMELLYEDDLFDLLVSLEYKKRKGIKK